MSNFDFTKTLLNGSKQYIDKKVSDGSTHSHSFNDLEDKPFYFVEGIETVYIPETTLSNFSERTYISDKTYYQSRTMVDYYVQFDANKTYTVIWDGVRYDNVTCTSTMGGAMLGSSERDLAHVDSTSNKYPFGIIMYNSSGNELVVSADDNKSSHTVKVADIIKESELKTLDRKYLPEHLQFGETQRTILVDNLTSEELSNGNAPECTFIPGQAYTVIWNGTTYENLICYDDNGYNVLASTDNGYPFYIDDDGGGSLYIESDTEDESFTVSIITDEIAQLDRKYITAHLASLPVYPGKKVEGQTFTIDGEEIVAEYGAEIFNFYGNIATGNNSHAEGSYTKASGTASHAEGENTKASGNYSHAEGCQTKASGRSAHAEGIFSTASGSDSHAEGENTTASGQTAHAEGTATVASGMYSHAEGFGTIASSMGQHVHGMCNIEDAEGKYIEIVGNSTNQSARSNAHTLDWNGNAWFAGNIEGKSIISRGTEDVTPRIQFHRYDDTDYNIRIRTDHPTVNDIEYNDLHFEGADSYYFDNAIRNTNSIYVGEKAYPTDGKLGAALTPSGILHLQGSSTLPSVYFYAGEGITEPNGRIYTKSDDKMYFNDAYSYSFDAHVRTNKAFYTFGKQSMSDGKAGCVIYDGVIDLVGSTSDVSSVTKPMVRFYMNGSTKPDAFIDLDSDTMNFTGATTYEFDNTFIVNNGVVRLKSNSGTSPQIQFWEKDSTAYDAVIYTASDVMYLKNAAQYQFDNNISTPSNYYFGYNKPTTASGVLTTWNDNKNHYMVGRNADGLGCTVGWAGSSSYATVLTIQGRTCKMANSSGTSTLSDERLKKDFTELDKWESFYKALEPCAFKMKAGNSGRYHMGFKAQQVEKALLENELTTQDFGGFIKMAYQPSIDDPEGNAVYEEAGIKEGDDEYGLIYTEFVALNTHMIKKLMNKIDKLEEEIKCLKNQ